MNAHTEIDAPAVRGARRVPAPRLVERPWGYILRLGPDRPRLVVIAEIGATFVGTMLLLTAAGQWFLPGTTYTLDVIGLKIAMSVVFGVFGGVFFWFARRGFCQEMQVDLVHQTFRMAHRNRNGRTTLASEVPFDEVRSVFLHRSKAHVLPSRLCLRLTDDETAIEIAIGDEANLTPVMERIGGDLKAARLGQLPVRPRVVTPIHRIG